MLPKIREVIEINAQRKFKALCAFFSTLDLAVWSQSKIGKIHISATLELRQEVQTKKQKNTLTLSHPVLYYLSDLPTIEAWQFVNLIHLNYYHIFLTVFFLMWTKISLGTQSQNPNPPPTETNNGSALSYLAKTCQV